MPVQGTTTAVRRGLPVTAIGDTCDETPTPCSNIECSSSEEGEVKAPGACSQTDVIGRCDCPYDEVTYYRSSFVGDAVEDCEFWCDEGAYTPL